MTVILASRSPRRRELLATLVADFEIQVPDVDETLPAGPIEAAIEAVAHRKAEAIQAGPDDIIVAADTLVVADAVLGQPEDAGAARGMLEQLDGTWHRVVTGWVVHGPTPRSGHATTRVRFALPADVRDAYLASGAWKGKAGGYGLQDPEIEAFAQIDGSRSNVLGLPLEPVSAALADNGIGHKT